jgi:hypothetical protein
MSAKLVTYIDTIKKEFNPAGPIKILFKRLDIKKAEHAKFPTYEGYVKGFYNKDGVFTLKGSFLVLNDSFMKKLNSKTDWQLIEFDLEVQHYKGFPYYKSTNLNITDEEGEKMSHDGEALTLTMEDVQKMLEQPELFRECSTLDQIRDMLPDLLDRSLNL